MECGRLGAAMWKRGKLGAPTVETWKVKGCKRGNVENSELQTWKCGNYKFRISHHPSSLYREEK